MGSEKVKPPDLGVHREHRPRALRCLRFCTVYPTLLCGITLVLDGELPAKAQQIKDRAYPTLMSIGSHTKAQTSEKEKGPRFCWCASSTMYSDQPAGGLQTILRAQTKHSGLFTEHPQSLLSPLF